MTTIDDREGFIDQLAARIRADLYRRRGNSQEELSSGVQEREQSVPIDWSRLSAQLSAAEDQGHVFTTTPVMNHYRGLKKMAATLVGKAILYLAQVFTKHQEAFNLSIVHALQSSNEGLKQLERSASETRKRMSALPGIEASVAEIAKGSQAFESRLSDLAGRVDALPGIQNRLEETARHVEILKQEMRLAEIVQGLAALSRMEEEFSQVTKRIEPLERLDKSVAEISSRLDILPSLERRIDEATRSLQMMQSLELRVSRFQADLTSVERRFDEATRSLHMMQSLDLRVSKFQADLTKLMLNHVAQERRLGTVLQEARDRLPKPFDRKQLEVLSGELESMDDELYVAFEDQFRGSRDEIRDRSKMYLPTLERAHAGLTDRPILDIGCGRGEWLELLKEEGMAASGIDINAGMVEECRALGLDVVKGDVMKHLQTLDEESLGAVTGFHLIEHLRFADWVSLLNQVHRVLRRGGVAILETPNPENVLVGSNTFYLDPTHRNPLPNALVKFVAESRGFSPVEVLPLHPAEASNHIREDSEVAHRFNHYFYGPRDYAIVAWKGQQFSG